MLIRAWLGVAWRGVAVRGVGWSGAGYVRDQVFGMPQQKVKRARWEVRGEGGRAGQSLRVEGARRREGGLRTALPCRGPDGPGWGLHVAEQRSPPIKAA